MERYAAPAGHPKMALYRHSRRKVKKTWRHAGGRPNSLGPAPRRHTLAASSDQLQWRISKPSFAKLADELNLNVGSTGNHFAQHARLI